MSEYLDDKASYTEGEFISVIQHFLSEIYPLSNYSKNTGLPYTNLVKYRNNNLATGYISLTERICEYEKVSFVMEYHFKVNL